ncbi:glucosyltransferase domain-containing protein [Pseudomonas sp. P867]|uniref:glucosyltransferase domain-containing protein n=1 Tax=Pseudomonas sp. P867 TaxID=2816050 RepID=UPI001CA60646|nr:glucosyltransferase domain-containing protein [Pseudomonas sp. P867]MBY8968786.1 glucosyltransferase domain-containing protein [Pseudomonas sp. P867]
MTYSKNCFISCLMILGVALIPIFSSNIYYMDDLYRIVLGIKGWSGDARPFAEIFYSALTLQSVTVPDLYPAPLILAVVFSCFVFSMLSTRFSNGRDILFAFCICPLILNPLFVSNLHFKYDSPFMVVSVAFALLSFCFELKKIIACVFITAIFVTLTLSTYQVSVNVFAALTVVEFLHVATKGDFRAAVLRLFNRGVGFIVGYLIYSKIIIPLVQVNKYFLEYSTAISLDKSGVLKVFDNLMSSFSIFTNSQSLGFEIFVLCLVSAYFLTIVNLLISSYKSINPIALGLSCILAFFTFVLLIPGVMIFSEQPLFFARGYIGFGAFVSAMLIPLCWASVRALRYILVIPYIYMVGFIYAAHNAFRLENDHIERTAISIIDDINKSGNADINYMRVDGVLKNSSGTEVIVAAYPLVKNILPKAFSYQYDGGLYVIKRLGLPDVKYATDEKAEAVSNSCMPKLKRYYYEICFGAGDTAYVRFK